MARSYTLSCVHMSTRSNVVVLGSEKGRPASNDVMAVKDFVFAFAFKLLSMLKRIIRVNSFLC
jgi:hypothetical protein